MRFVLLSVICYSFLSSFHANLHGFVNRYVSFYDPCTIQADDFEYSNESCAPSPYQNLNNLEIIGKISTVPRRFIEKVPNVENLSIRNNSLTSIDGTSICQWKRLGWIDADLNSLEKLSNGFLFHCKQLERLLLHSNKIKEIAPDAFSGLKSLRYLDLSSNQITSLGKDVLKPLRKLENLNLSKNRIQVLDLDVIQYNSLIGVLDLSNNNLKAIPSELFQMLHYLEFFSAGNNPKVNSIDIRQSDSLKSLSMFNASLTEIFIPSNVESVFLNSNKISQIFVEPDNALISIGLTKNCMTNPLLEGPFNNLEHLTLRENPMQIESMNDLSVVKIKAKYPSIILLDTPTIDDVKAKQMISEAEENQIDLAICGYLFEGTDSLTHFQFAHFGSMNFENYGQKFYITSTLKEYFTNKVKDLIVAKTNTNEIKPKPNKTNTIEKIFHYSPSKRIMQEFVF